MAETFRLNGRPQQQQRGGIDRTVSARQGDYLAAMPAQDAELRGLVDGLSQLSPRLAALQQKQDAEAADQAALEAQAAAQRVENPLQAVSGSPVEAPVGLPLAADRAYRESFGTVLAQRAGIQQRELMLKDYMAERDTEGFSIDGFLDKRRQDLLGSMRDPLLVATTGKALQQVEAELRGDFLQVQQKRHEEAKNTAVAALANDAIRPDMKPTDIAQSYFTTLLPQLSQLGLSKSQSAGVLLNQVVQASTAAGGAPELYEVFESKDAEGFTLLERNPSLAGPIQQAKQAAAQMRDKAINEATEPLRAKMRMKIDDDIRAGNTGYMTIDFFAGLTGKNGFQDATVAEMYHRSQISRAAGAAAQNVDAAAASQGLWAFDNKTQNEALERRFGGAVKGLLAATMQGDSAKAAQLGQELFVGVGSTGATVTLEPLANFFEATVSTLPAKEGPSPQFLAAAALYEAGASQASYRDRHVKPEAARVLEAYNRAKASTDPMTAYKAAYRHTDPEVKREAERVINSEAGRKMVSDIAESSVAGTTWLPRFLGGEADPANLANLRAWGAGEAKAYMLASGDLDEASVKAHLERAFEKNYVLDTTTKLAVKVPPEEGGPQLSKALSAYSEAFTKRLQAENRFPEDAKVTYVASGTQGLFDVVMVSNGARKSVGTVTSAQLKDWHVRQTTIDPKTEGPALAGYLQALRSGAPLPPIDDALLGKALSTRTMKGADVAALRKLHAEQLRGRIQAAPRMNLGSPNEGTSLYQGPAVIDHGQTAQAALDLANTGPTAANNHSTLAASLITQREGMALKAYDDPAKGAGQNIGMGYNLNANAATLESDFKRAGIPPSMIDAVRSGKAQLTPDQAKKLLLVALPRYEKQTKAVADSTAPGLWDKMLPAERAVMIDIAYQVGDPAKYKQAWAALEKGDNEAFAKEVSSFYKRSSDGAMVEDTRGKRLRAAMLDGIPRWTAELQQSGKRPSNALQTALTPKP